MTGSQIIFIVFAALTIVSTVMAVTSRSTARALIFFLAVLCATSGIFIVLNFRVLAVIHLALYTAGAFIILRSPSLRRITAPEEVRKPKGWIISVVAGSLALALSTLTIVTIVNFRFAPVKAPPAAIDPASIAGSLFSAGKEGYLLPSILIVLMIITALISASAITASDEPADKKTSL